MRQKYGWTTAGAGGYGPPAERTADALAGDRRETVPFAAPVHDPKAPATAAGMGTCLQYKRMINYL